MGAGETSRQEASSISDSTEAHSDTGANNGSATDQPDEITLAIDRSFELLDVDDYAGAREVIERALACHSENVQLLIQLAWNYAHDPTARSIGIEKIRALYRDRHSDVHVTIGYLSILRYADEVGEALEAARALPDSTRSLPRVSGELAQLYMEVGWHYRAQSATRQAAESRAERLRLCSSKKYWRTGGPLIPLRQMGERVEKEAEQIWIIWRENLQELPQITMPHDVQAMVRRDVDTYLLEWSLRESMYRRNRRVATAPLRAILIILAFCYSALEFWRGGKSTLHEAAMAGFWAVLVVSVSAIFLLVANRVLSILRSRRAYFAIGLVGWSLINVGYALTPQAGTSDAIAPWAVFLRTSLKLLAITIPILYLSRVVVDANFGRKVRRLRQQDPKATVLDALLDALRWNSETAKAPYDLSQRSFLIHSIERAAHWISNELPQQFEVADDETKNWAHERAAGVAAAIRASLRDAIATTENSPAKVARKLQRCVTLLATGRLGELPYREPPVITRPTLKDRAKATAKTLLVMLMPALFFFTLTPLTGLPEALVSWGRIASFVWFLLYLAILLDPDLKSKLEIARGISDLGRGDKPEDSKPD